MSETTLKYWLFGFIVWSVCVIGFSLWIEGGTSRRCNEGSPAALFTDCVRR